MTAPDPRVEQARDLLESAAQELRQDRFAGARGLLEQALALAGPAGDRELEALATHRLGTCDLAEERWPQAQERLERALAIRREIGDRAGEAASLSQLGLLRLYRREFAEARTLTQAALAIDEALGDRRGAAMTRAQLAAAAMEEGAHDEAARGFRDAVAALLGLGDLHSAASAYANSASLARRMGRTRGALRLLLLTAMLKTTLKHPDAEEAVSSANLLASELALGDVQMEADYLAVHGGFGKDQGLSVLEEALGLEEERPGKA